MMDYDSWINNIQIHSFIDFSLIVFFNWKMAKIWLEESIKLII